MEGWKFIEPCMTDRMRAGKNGLLLYGHSILTRSNSRTVKGLIGNIRRAYNSKRVKGNNMLKLEMKMKG